jgi:hypothetical protein
MPTVIGASSGWTAGLVLGVVVVLVAAAIVIAIVVLLDGIGRINDSGVRILHAARALRKVAVGR